MLLAAACLPWLDLKTVENISIGKQTNEKRIKAEQPSTALSYLFLYLIFMYSIENMKINRVTRFCLTVLIGKVHFFISGAFLAVLFLFYLLS